MALGLLQHHELLSLAEADPHQLYPKPPIACLDLTNTSCVAPRATSKPWADMKPCPRGAGCEAQGQPPAVSPAQCPLAGRPALDALRQRGLRGRHHRWLLHGTRWVWGWGVGSTGVGMGAPGGLQAGDRT